MADNQQPYILLKYTHSWLDIPTYKSYIQTLPVTTTGHPQALLKLIIPDIVADRTLFREVAGDGLFTDIPAAESWARASASVNKPLPEISSTYFIHTSFTKLHLSKSRDLTFYAWKCHNVFILFYLTAVKFFIMKWIYRLMST